jgi:uncharacterized repeat protein (TIGR03803 family)
MHPLSRALIWGGRLWARTVVTLAVGLLPGIVGTQSTQAQTFSVLYTFNGPPDGAYPSGPLIRDAAGNLYGVTSAGGSSSSCSDIVSGCGVVFKLDPTGNETVLYTFTGPPDGAHPSGGLVRDEAGNFYGTTSAGGVSNFGTVFKLDTNGTETVLYSFNLTDGAYPSGSLVRDAAGNLYGTTFLAGSGNGLVFRLGTTGNETILHSFGVGLDGDGAGPGGGLVQDALGNLYGTTVGGGISNCTSYSGSPPYKKGGCGTVFKLDAAATESLLYTFNGGDQGPDGARPSAGLTLDSAGNLYGTTAEGGLPNCFIGVSSLPHDIPIGCGTVFKLDPTGNETLLHSFTGADGAEPGGGLVRDASGNLYGTTGSNVFKLDSSGKVSMLYIFTRGADGAFPVGLSQDSAGNLYGTTSGGGDLNCGDPGGCGTVFKVTETASTTFNVSVRLGGNGSGTVTSQPAGIDCGTTCWAGFVSGTVLTLSATPVSGSTFVEWGGACAGTVACTLTPSAAASVTATFNVLAMPDFSLTPAATSFTVQPGGQGTDAITVAAQNGAFGSAIQLSCAVAGPAPMPTCALSPASVTPGADSAVSMLTIAAPTLAMVTPPFNAQLKSSLYSPWLPLGILGITLVAGSKKQRHRYWMISVFPVLLVALELGCGGGSGRNHVVQQPTNYTVTVTGASGTIQHTTEVAVNVP